MQLASKAFKQVRHDFGEWLKDFPESKSPFKNDVRERPRTAADAQQQRQAEHFRAEHSTAFESALQQLGIAVDKISLQQQELAQDDSEEDPNGQISLMVLTEYGAAYHSRSNAELGLSRVHTTPVRTSLKLAALQQMVR